MTELLPSAALPSEAGSRARLLPPILMEDAAFTLDTYPDYITIESARTQRETGKQSGKGGNVSDELKPMTDEELAENIAWLAKVETRKVELRKRLAKLAPAIVEQQQLEQELCTLTGGGRTERFERAYNTSRELLRRELAK